MKLNFIQHWSRRTGDCRSRCRGIIYELLFLFQVKKEEKEFLEQENEDEDSCQLQKRQLEQRLNVSEMQTQSLQRENANLIKSKSDAVSEKNGKLLYFKNLSDECLKDMGRMQKQLKKSNSDSVWKERKTDDKVSELDKCNQNIKRLEKFKTEFLAHKHARESECEDSKRRLSAMKSEQSKILSDLENCQFNITSLKTTQKSNTDFKSKIEDAYRSGKPPKIGGYSYIIQILYKYGLL